MCLRVILARTHLFQPFVSLFLDILFSVDESRRPTHFTDCEIDWPMCMFDVCRSELSPWCLSGWMISLFLILLISHEVNPCSTR